MKNCEVVPHLKIKFAKNLPIDSIGDQRNLSIMQRILHDCHDSSEWTLISLKQSSNPSTRI